MGNFLMFMRWVAAWVLYRLGYALHGMANPLIDWSQKAQGFYGFKRWPWSEGDLWLGREESLKFVTDATAAADHPNE